ncbi:MAG: hypothetical protein LH603_00730 [Pseudonocardia sp.]|nr:hypothetical protein [Pseudonocardia sp.]
MSGLVLSPAPPTDLPARTPVGVARGVFRTMRPRRCVKNVLRRHDRRGADLMLVERVIGRLTWGRVLVSGAASGAWFGLVLAAIGYRATHGRRDFTSASQMVAGRYDVLCQPRNAEKARELLAKLAMGSLGIA